MRAKIRKHHLFKNQRQDILGSEIQGRKLETSELTQGTPKEIIPSVAFSHNGTYPQGASPKIVHDANITYHAVQKSVRSRYVRKGRKDKRKHVCGKVPMHIAMDTNGVRNFIVVPDC